MACIEDYANRIIQGDCLEVLKDMPDNSVDTVITDPPYHLVSINKRFKNTSLSDDTKTSDDAQNGAHQYARLSKGFMGKEWDGGGIAFNTEVWEECLRVVKPGGILFAFGGTRTYHRLTCAIEDAGWEIRDCVNYFHSGDERELALLDSMTPEQIEAYLELHYPNKTVAWVYGSGFPKALDISKAIDKRNGKEREIVGEYAYPDGKPRNTSEHKTKRNGIYGHIKSDDSKNDRSKTAPASPDAITWNGWKSPGLKPAHEPIIMAEKPIEGAYVDNVLKWGVAGLWIDGARVPTQDEEPNVRNSKTIQGKEYNDNVYSSITRNGNGWSGNQGRWPANVILDKEAARLLDEQAGPSPARPVKPENIGKSGDGQSKGLFGNGSKVQSGYYDKSSGVSRFFYCAKASKRERGDYNNHPTVKPLSLLEYLCKLSRTPTGGTVLDPFAGSGTTALAALKTGRQYICIEQDEHYVEIAERRVSEFDGVQLELPQGQMRRVGKVAPDVTLIVDE